MLRIKVLGSAAGGGFPQWNCHCPQCNGVRTGRIRAQARMQSSLALSSDPEGRRWVVLNASPDIRHQLRAFLSPEPPAFHSAEPSASLPRWSPVHAVTLLDAQLDHTLGLFTLREAHVPVLIHGTAEVRNDLSRSLPVLDVLDAFSGFRWVTAPFAPEWGTWEGMPGIRYAFIALKGHAPRYSRDREAQESEGHTSALVVEDITSGRRMVYAPSLGSDAETLAPYLSTSDCAFVDGTFWRDDELGRLVPGARTAREMGHRPLGGPEGLLAFLNGFPRPRKILVHINNTNPILNEDSAERAEVHAQGIEVAHDGLEVLL